MAKLNFALVALLVCACASAVIAQNVIKNDSITKKARGGTPPD